GLFRAQKPYAFDADLPVGSDDPAAGTLEPEPDRLDLAVSFENLACLDDADIKTRRRPQTRFGDLADQDEVGVFNGFFQFGLLVFRLVGSPGSRLDQECEEGGEQGEAVHAHLLNRKILRKGTRDVRLATPIVAIAFVFLPLVSATHQPIRAVSRSCRQAAACPFDRRGATVIDAGRGRRQCPSGLSSAAAAPWALFCSAQNPYSVHFLLPFSFSWVVATPL